MASSTDVVGPLATTIEDVQLVLDVIKVLMSTMRQRLTSMLSQLVRRHH